MDEIYDDDELLERLRNFSSDSPYEIGLIEAAVRRIEELERRVEDAVGYRLHPDTWA